MAGFDPRGRRELLELLVRLQKDRDLTLIVCSASLTDASLLCDRFVVLDRGSVVADGPAREVLREPVIAARELRKAFPDFPTSLLTEEELEAELVARLGAS